MYDQRMYKKNKGFIKDDRRWFCAFFHTFDSKFFRFWLKTSDSHTTFRELCAFLQQSFNADQLLLTLKILANLNEIQIESFFDVEQLTLRLRALASQNKTQFEIKSIRDISARVHDQESLVFNSDASMISELLSNFDVIIKNLFFDKSKTISRCIYLMTLRIARAHTNCFDRYVQSMIVWNTRDFSIMQLSVKGLMRDYWSKRIIKGLSHENTLNKIRARKSKNVSNDNSCSELYHITDDRLNKELLNAVHRSISDCNGEQNILADLTALDLAVSLSDQKNGMSNCKYRLGAAQWSYVWSMGKCDCCLVQGVALTFT